MQFKVLQIPEGEAPLAVREQWVGLTLPVVEVLGPRTGYGVLTGNEATMENAVAVGLRDGVQALRDADKQEAADWWQRIPRGQLLFEESWGELL